jgi:hypothetical protein
MLVMFHSNYLAFAALLSSSQKVVRVPDYRQVLERNGLHNWLVFERGDVRQGITHTEFYRRRVSYRLSRLPLLGRIFKPLAKVGIRTSSVPGQGGMEDFIRTLFNDFNDKTAKEREASMKLGLLVYMWVAPRWRGMNLGEMLLGLAVEQCTNKGDKYMLCVHDDQGSGKLVEWYRQRNFYDLPGEVLDKGLVGALVPPSPAAAPTTTTTPIGGVIITPTAPAPIPWASSSSFSDSDADADADADAPDSSNDSIVSVTKDYGGVHDSPEE